ncbi:hypothetical protein SDC9_198550 [bioreactor metagenome]|uniref:Uncharacterized protein n=1 Tax=bioreactor metagenome TaxID=1076179 RepID=A0A645IIG6_9ZZZZ
MLAAVSVKPAGVVVDIADPAAAGLIPLNGNACVIHRELGFLQATIGCGKFFGARLDEFLKVFAMTGQLFLGANPLGDVL